MGSPIVENLVLTSRTTTYQAGGERSVALYDPDDPLRIESQTDTFSLNDGSGWLDETVCFYYDSALGTRRQTVTCAEGRHVVQTLDDPGRITRVERPGQLALNVAYDLKGRLSTPAWTEYLTTQQPQKGLAPRDPSRKPKLLLRARRERCAHRDFTAVSSSARL